MNRQSFSYDLPNELIAQVPLKDRSHSRLLVADSLNQILTDKAFLDLPDVLDQAFQLKQNQKKVLLIANDSRVYHARIPVRRKTGGKGEVFLLETGERDAYKCLLKPKGKLSVDEELFSAQEPSEALFVVDSLNPPRVRLSSGQTFQNIMEKYGEVPLPPYIKRASQNSEDKQRYQTVYSNHNQVGSSAAPTAGLHFTDEMIQKCKENQVEFGFVTLNVGLGTFLPVSTDQIQDHTMHEEHYLITPELIEQINLFLTKEWPIVFVGTTSLRAVESFLRLFFIENPQRRLKIKELANTGELIPLLSQKSNTWLSTKLFLYPKDEHHKETPCIGHGILTNFHQPESTLVMLVSSLIGFDFWKKMYRHAVNQKYRFFSYGDSSFILFHKD